ncbi:MAG: DMT family transporter [Cyclobacteriaceae bacterium]
MEQKTPLKAWLLLFVLSLIWGSSFILIKRGLVALDYQEVGALRIFSASLVMLPIALSKLARVKRKQVKYLLSIGFLGSLIPAFLFAIAQTQLKSSITGVLNALTPISTMLVGYLIYKQKQTSSVFVGVAIGFVGTAVLILTNADGGFGTLNFYALFVILATVMYAFNLNIIKYHLSELDSLTITSISLLVVGPIAGIHLFFFTEFPNHFAQEAVLISAGYIVILGVIGTAVALIIFNNLVRITDPVFTSSVTYIIPIVAVLWGFSDGESLSWLHFAGICGILLGVYITNSAKRK